MPHEPPLATTTTLLQNYPNPCGGQGLTQTNFTFRTGGGHATLRIVDSRGDIVKTLLDGAVMPGERTIALNTQGLASGSYFCTLEAGGTVSTTSMVIVR